MRMIIGDTEKHCKSIHLTTQMNYTNSLRDTIYQSSPKKKQINLNSPILIQDVKFVVKIFSTKKCPGPEVFLGEFYYRFKEEIIDSTQNLLEYKRGEKISYVFSGGQIILIPKQGNNTTRKENITHQWTMLTQSKNATASYRQLEYSHI